MSNWYRTYQTILEEQTSPMVLAPECNPSDYQITNSFRDIDMWKATSYYGAEYRDGTIINKGDWDSVGYVMISKIDNTIIPIARSDEHHKGFDMMYDRYKNINTNNYVPIWVPGNQYAYDQSDLNKLKIVLPKFLEYGGNPNSFIIGSNDFTGIKMTAQQIVNGEEFIKHSDPTKLATVGQMIYDSFANAAKAVETSLSTQKPADFKNAVRACRKIIQTLSDISDVGTGYEGNAAEDLRAIENSQDINQLQEIVFGFGGIKNKLHNNLKEANELDDRNYYWKSNFIANWGNLNLAIDMLSRL